MGYHVVDPQELDREPNRPSDMRYISEAADMQHMGLRVYYVEPGEDIPKSGLHADDVQEEVFYVVDGALHVETPDRVYEVGQGQFFIAEPQNPHRAFNDGDADGMATVLGIGAPK